MHLDDLDTENEQRFEQYLSKIKVIKNIGHKIIAFVEQIENFQKKLWLKKKFVVESEYCITLDKIPTEFYQAIARNQEQVSEWIRLLNIDKIEGYSKPLSIEFLKENPFLMLDTQFFNKEFSDELISTFSSLDEELDGTIIHSENFQGLNLIKSKYNDSVNYIYIDPPYNAQSSEILYKNTFKHSSWLSLMENRIRSSKSLLTREGVFTCAIDEIEQERLGLLLDNIFEDTYARSC